MVISKVIYFYSDEEVRDYEDIVCCAMRYCIGRRTYITGFMCDWYGARIKEWSDHSLSLAIHDIDSAYSLGDERIDKPSWLELRAKIYTELKERLGVEELERLDIKAGYKNYEV